MEPDHHLEEHTGYNQKTGGFTDTEKTYVQSVWAYVAETYAAFDVDVTTDTGTVASQYNRSNSTDLTYGDHVVFSDDPTSYAICNPNQGCGGVAVVGGFDDPTDNSNFAEPAWVRTKSSKGSYGAFSTAMAASHEIGHTLGLDHDAQVKHGSTAATDYYGGAGSWTPIMGSGDHAIHQFSNGDYKYANNKQDDLAVMVAHGAPKLYDEAGSTPSTAATLGAQPSYTVPGVITSRTDVDTYEFGPCPTTPTVSANGTGLGKPLDIKLNLLAQDASLDGTSNPATGAADPHPNPGLNAGPLTGHTTGQYYYAQVDGVGWGDPMGTGYSDYGSIGSYTVSISGCGATSTAAPGAPASVTLSNSKASGTLHWTAPSRRRVRRHRLPDHRPGRRRRRGRPEHPLPRRHRQGRAGQPVPGRRDQRRRTRRDTHERRDRHRHLGPHGCPDDQVLQQGQGRLVLLDRGREPRRGQLDHWHVNIDNGYEYDVSADSIGTAVSAPAYGTFNAKFTPVYNADSGTAPTRSLNFTVSWKPNAPKIGKASSGSKGGSKTAVARWSGAVNNKSAIKTYKVYAYKLTASNKVAKTYKSASLKSSARSYSYKLPPGGTSSGCSRPTPGAPRRCRATRGSSPPAEPRERLAHDGRVGGHPHRRQAGCAGSAP